jgi:hypothetical protein
MALLLVSSIVGCQKEPQPTVTPALAIMVESNTVEAGSSFVVYGSNFKPYQKWVWVEIQYKAFDPPIALGIVYRDEADENGSIYVVVDDIVEAVVPGDYEIEISTGKNVHNREVIATLPILIKSKE